MEKIRLFLVDDHRMVTESWALMFNADPRFIVTGYATQSDQALAFVQQYTPDVILTDIAMTPFDGIELTQSILQHCPGCKIIGVSLYSSPRYVKRMFEAGARGYVSKNSSKDELCRAIFEVYSGNKYISNDIKDRLVQEGLEDSKFRALTRTELHIIDLLREGLSSKEVAAKEHISIKTVEVHRYNILRKLELPNMPAVINAMNAKGW